MLCYVLVLFSSFKNTFKAVFPTNSLFNFLKLFHETPWNNGIYLQLTSPLLLFPFSPFQLSSYKKKERKKNIKWQWTGRSSSKILITGIFAKVSLDELLIYQYACTVPNCVQNGPKVLHNLYLQKIFVQYLLKRRYEMYIMYIL